MLKKTIFSLMLILVFGVFTVFFCNKCQSHRISREKYKKKSRQEVLSSTKEDWNVCQCCLKLPKGKKQKSCSI